MTNKKRILLTSFAAVLLCICALLGFTYAYFTDSVSIKNHLQSGNLDVTLTRTNLEYKVLDDQGYLVVKEDTADINFTDSVNKNIFGLDAEGLKIAPTSYFEAELKLTNDGTVAFDYSVIIKLSSETNKLAEQINVIITHANGTKTEKLLSEFAAGVAVKVGQMGANTTAETFTVKVEFLDDALNNLAASKEVVFDLIVNATQASK